MQAMKKSKKKPAAKSAPEKAKKTKQVKEEQNEKQPLLKTLIFGEEKPDLTELEAGSTTILDILSPTTVDTKSRDYIVVDGVFHTYLYVTGYGYTTTVGSCWLAPLVEAGEGVNMSFLVKRQSKEKILSKISQTTMVNRSRMRDVGDTRQDYEELDSAISSGLYLKDVMNRQGEDFYYMHTLIEVTAPDPETLEQRVTEVEKLCVSVDMIARRCDYKNEQAFLSSLPILALDPDIERKARRNALTSGVAAAFPFASYELSDHNGIFLGLNLYNRSPVFLDPYDDYKYTNGNWWIGGSTGAGKTVTLQCLGGRLRQQGKRVIIIAPKKGHEFRPLCEKLGGLYLRMSPSSKDCPNLMAIRRKSLDSYAKLKNIAARDDSVLADKIAQLIKVHLSVMRGVLHIVNSRMEIFFSPLQGFSQFLIVRLNRKLKPMTGFLCNGLKRMKRPVITGKLNGNGFDFVRRNSVALNLKRIQKVCLLCGRGRSQHLFQCGFLLGKRQLHHSFQIGGGIGTNSGHFCFTSLLDFCQIFWGVDFHTGHLFIGRIHFSLLFGNSGILLNGVFSDFCKSFHIICPFGKLEG